MLMFSETLKKKLDSLTPDQLAQVATFITGLESHSNAEMQTQAIPKSQRAQSFLEWVTSLPKSEISLPDEAFSRDRIYE